MDATPFLTGADVAELRQLDRDGQATAMLFWADPFDVIRLDRDGGWDDGTSLETAPVAFPGVGALITGGAGGDQADAVIVGLSPYRLEFDAALDVRDTDLIRVGGLTGRVFLVDSIERGGVDALIATAHLRERT